MKKATLIQQSKILMGSPFSIQCYVAENNSATAVDALMLLAFCEIARIEDLLTDFRDSPFNEINKQAGVSPVAVGHEIYSLIKKSIEFSKQSGGAFDISYASVGHLWREAMKTKVVPDSMAIKRAKEFVDYQKIFLNDEKGEVYLPHPEMKIGLGGIGKGYAVDRAFKLLRSYGLENFVVNGAGDIHVHSAPNAPRPWQIGIRNPFAKRDVAMGSLQIKNGAVATSGDYERFLKYRGEKYHHVLDGRTGEITKGVVSVTVFAATTLQADVYATTVMALGPQKGITFLNSQEDVSGFLVTAEGHVIKTRALHQPEGIQHAQY